MGKLLSADDIVRCAAALAVPVATLRAVIAVESSGDGFVDELRPRILFEGHIFHRLTDGRFAAMRPDLSHPAWSRDHYRGGQAEYERLRAAISLDADAALQSCSWGLGQVMGFNHRLCGFAGVDDFVNAMACSEGRQLDVMAAFIGASDLASPLRREAWEEFARRYNGPGYRTHGYHTRLAAAVAEARRSEQTDALVPPTEDRARVAGLQRALNATIGAGLVVDGRWGPRTRAAVLDFQRAQGLEATGVVDDALAARLGIDRA